MPEDVTHNLKAFTPVGLDRDAVLFAAGKAAARRWGVWKWLSVGLLATNAMTLGIFFWPKPVAPPPRAVTSPSIVVPEPIEPDPSSYITLMQSFDPAVPQPPADVGRVRPGRPLTPRDINDPRFH